MRRKYLIVCPIDAIRFRTLTEFCKHCRKRHADRMEAEADALTCEQLDKDHRKLIVSDLRRKHQRTA